MHPTRLKQFTDATRAEQAGKPYEIDLTSGRVIPASHYAPAPTPDLTPVLHWPSFAAGAVFAVLVFAMAVMGLRA